MKSRCPPVTLAPPRPSWDTTAALADDRAAPGGVRAGIAPVWWTVKGLGFEIEKLRELRNRKRQRFMVALTVSAATLMAMLVRLALI